ERGDGPGELEAELRAEPHVLEPAHAVEPAPLDPPDVAVPEQQREAHRFDGLPLALDQRGDLRAGGLTVVEVAARRNQWRAGEPGLPVTHAQAYQARRAAPPDTAQHGDIRRLLAHGHE